MKRVLAMATAAGTIFGLCVTSALALPPVMERIPDDALVSIVVPSPDNLQKNAAKLTVAIGADQGMPIPSVQDLLSMGGITGGVDPTKSVAVLFFGPKDWEARTKAGEKVGIEEGDRRFIALVPITNFADLIKNFGPDIKPDPKMTKLTMPDGTDGFAKDIGNGYAAVSGDEPLLTAFEGKAGTLKARMGKAGESLSDSSDLVTIINMDRLRSAAEKGLKEGLDQAKQNMQGVPGGENAEASLQLFSWLGEIVVRDTQVLVGGLNMSDAGLSFNMVSSFKEGSYLAKAVSGKGNSAPLLSKLPTGPYLWAGAVDASMPGMKQLWKDVIARSPGTAGPASEKSKASMVEFWDKTEGHSAVIGFPMGGAFAGILTATVGYSQSKDPAGSTKLFKDVLLSSDGQKVEGVEGVTVKATYTESGAKAGETSVDVWDMKFAGDQQAQGQLQQGMAFVFGPQGAPGGYIAKTDAGFYTTYSKNSELMSKAVAAGKGGENISADANLKHTQAMLPKDRLAEMYVGSKSILDLALPFAAMAGMAVPQDKLPQAVHPIGASISADNGAARMTIVVPTSVLKTGYTLAQSFEEAQMNAENQENPQDGDKPDRSTGQPKF